MVTDDLRDYRFYARDLVHPSDTAVEYIWDVFQETYLDSVGKEKLKAGEKETKRSLHRNIIGNR
ncbi:GSCFA domain-containing protein [Barnesiella sp. CU968]|uniref:GSCFA domain-containing protein n=1 Tax=Barnesiella sp. CU968 TaxID=2780099 RepID=UPI00351BFB64